MKHQISEVVMRRPDTATGDNVTDHLADEQVLVVIYSEKYVSPRVSLVTSNNVTFKGTLAWSSRKVIQSGNSLISFIEQQIVQRGGKSIMAGTNHRAPRKAGNNMQTIRVQKVGRQMGGNTSNICYTTPSLWNENHRETSQGIGKITSIIKMVHVQNFLNNRKCLTLTTHLS